MIEKTCRENPVPEAISHRSTCEFFCNLLCTFITTRTVKISGAGNGQVVFVFPSACSLSIVKDQTSDEPAPVG